MRPNRSRSRPVLGEIELPLSDSLQEDEPLLRREGQDRPGWGLRAANADDAALECHLHARIESVIAGMCPPPPPASFAPIHLCPRFCALTTLRTLSPDGRSDADARGPITMSTVQRGFAPVRSVRALKSYSYHEQGRAKRALRRARASSRPWARPGIDQCGMATAQWTRQRSPGLPELWRCDVASGLGNPSGDVLIQRRHHAP